MQGFNRWIPPDYDPEKHHTLNDYHGKKALGDRERKRDQGILITRFELPFNIWCGTCNNHIGMGVRYNAEKKKVGNYYSTPIYSFRCKCHLCDGWFEIQTDPKNTRYVVTSGARKQEQDWDPEENGGFAAHETDPDKPPDDPLAALEKTAIQKQTVETVAKPRVEALQGLSEHYNADPYALSVKVRKKFREEKKAEKRKREEDDDFKTKWALDKDLQLVPDEEVRTEAKEAWEAGKKEFDREATAKRRALELDVGTTPISRASRLAPGPSSPAKSSSSHRMPSRIANSKPSSHSTKSALASTLLMNSLRKSDPFLQGSPRLSSGPRKDKPLGLLVKK
ncbi:hypothetical protein M407DRAFT_16827 [Tulasnella calospora MUT 4182]|uniref:DUF572-domain-containing protein n=1 Tax=Tulasnella calospora MUT 4182 TaxID=1051891 RepID=A0A0C3LJQ0_9AGAM|nr:hypothetical protein M407DRAFT_16827 [Tulasnella calospora MUT 4182]